MYKGARKQAGLSLFDAADRINVSTRALAYYEAKQRAPGPDVVLRMSQEYRRPDLTVRYCRECPIGTVYTYELLDNIDMSLPAVIMKLIAELREAMSAADALLDLVVNKRSKNDFSSEEWQKFLKAVHEFIDVEHNIEILKIVLEGLTEEKNLIPKLVSRHNQKCRERGYIKEKTPAFAVAK